MERTTDGSVEVCQLVNRTSGLSDLCLVAAVQRFEDRCLKPTQFRVEFPDCQIRSDVSSVELGP